MNKMKKATVNVTLYDRDSGEFLSTIDLCVNAEYSTVSNFCQEIRIEVNDKIDYLNDIGKSVFNVTTTIYAYDNIAIADRLYVFGQQIK
jgi:hypothetical protein